MLEFGALADSVKSLSLSPRGRQAKRLEAACPAEHNNVKILTNGSAVPRLALNLDDLTRVKSCAGHSLTVRS